MRMLAVVLFVLSTISPSYAHHLMTVIVPPLVKVMSGATSSAVLSGGSAAAAGGLGILGWGIAWCGANQPKRNLRRDTFVDGRHDVYPTNNYRKSGCVIKDPKRKTRPVVVSVRG